MCDVRLRVLWPRHWPLRSGLNAGPTSAEIAIARSPAANTWNPCECGSDWRWHTCAVFLEYQSPLHWHLYSICIPPLLYPHVPFMYKPRPLRDFAWGLHKEVGTCSGRVFCPACNHICPALTEKLCPHKGTLSFLLPNTILPATACKSILKTWLGELREGEKQGPSSALEPALFSHWHCSQALPLTQKAPTTPGESYEIVFPKLELFRCELQF